MEILQSSTKASISPIDDNIYSQPQCGKDLVACAISLRSIQFFNQFKPNFPDHMLEHFGRSWNELLLIMSAIIKLQ